MQDVTLVGATNGAIPGSLIIDPSNMSITFNATTNYLMALSPGVAAVLPDDTYTVTLVSGSGSNRRKQRNERCVEKQAKLRRHPLRL